VIVLLSTVGRVDLTGIVATSAVLTAVIGLSFQDTWQHDGRDGAAGGAFNRRRDWIHIDNQEGVVKEIRWRHTSIETRNWDTIIIPNTVLMNRRCWSLAAAAGRPGNIGCGSISR